MEQILELIDDRSAAFRAAISAAPGLDVPVPTCPEWTLADLAQHIGEGRRKWAAIVAAGPAGAPPPKPVWESAAPEDREELVAWLAESTSQLLAALREAGPERGCWTWWGWSDSPQNCGAGARHQLQEIAVHTYDAQLALGASQPLPEAVAVDGVEEFLVTCCTSANPWPHDPAVIDYRVAEGRVWRQHLSATGSRITAPDDEPADATLEGPASDLVLHFYGRLPLESLKFSGDRRIFDHLEHWDPSA